MSRNLEPERVIDLDAARARKAEGGRPARTLVLQVANVRADGETHRQVGVSDSLHLSDLRDVLVVSFSLDLTTDEGAPWSFRSADEVLDHGDLLHQHLGTPGDRLVFHWGLWQFQIVTAHSWLRDNGTPWALCVGGSGRFGDEPFNIAAINAALTGTSTTQSVLDLASAPVRSIIERSRIFDLVPLLQALDLSREVDLSAEVRQRLEDLPVEDGAAESDAFWATALGLSCLSDEALTDEIIESIIAALGWVDDDGSTLRGTTVRNMCADSLNVLAGVGGYGKDQLPPVDRLDIYRELLRSGE